MMKKKPVILQIVPELISGGVERGTIDIAKAISDAGYVSLVASSGGLMVPQLQAVGARHITLPLASKNPFQIYFNAKRIERLIQRYQVDIVHARSRAPAWSAYLASKRCGCHFMTTWHGTHSFKSDLKKRYNSIMGRGEKVIAVSEFIKSHILRHYAVEESRITVVHRGVDLDVFNPDKISQERITRLANRYDITHDQPVILLPARMTEWKGHLFLLEALAHVKDLPFVCVFAGKSDVHQTYIEAINKRIEALGLHGRVRIVNQISDMPALYALSTIVVSASMRPEAFGRVATEGQSMKKLVIATNHGGSKETVIDGKTGWLIEPGNVEQLGASLQHALQLDASAHHQMGEAARKHIELHFSLEGMCKQTIKLYDSLL